MNKIIFALLLVCSSVGIAGAKDYPEYPIKLIVPYSAGGPSDIIARTIAAKASELIGGSVIVDNRGGAGGTVGTALAVKANPDGYTLVMVSPGQVGIAMAGRDDLTYNPLTDLVPVVELVEDTLILSVSNKLPVKDLKELIAYVKAHPGQLNYSSASVGSITHLVMELFKQKFGLDIVHVPFKGSSESMMAIVTDQVNMGFASPSGMKAMLQEGKLHAIAIASNRRSSVMPDVPTMGELGFTNLDAPLWYVLAAPKGTPPAVLEKLRAAFTGALQDPGVQKTLTGLGVDVIGAGPDVAAKVMKADVERWNGLIKSAHIKLQ